MAPNTSNFDKIYLKYHSGTQRGADDFGKDSLFDPTNRGGFVTATSSVATIALLPYPTIRCFIFETIHDTRKIIDTLEAKKNLRCQIKLLTIEP